VQTTTLLAQVHAQTADYVGDIAAALAQVRVIDIGEKPGHLIERALERPIGVRPLFADERDGSRDQQRIVKHQELGIEERRQLGARPCRQPILDCRKLLAGSRTGPFDACDLGRDLLGDHRCPQRPSAADEQHRASDPEPRHDCRPNEPPHHRSSPKPEATSAQSSFNAAVASGPSAAMVRIVPRAAARRRMPMMLLPSTVRSPRVTRIAD
jgi:hypothetical protein